MYRVTVKFSISSSRTHRDTIISRAENLGLKSNWFFDQCYYSVEQRRDIREVFSKLYMLNYDGRVNYQKF